LEYLGSLWVVWLFSMLFQIFLKYDYWRQLTCFVEVRPRCYNGPKSRVLSALDTKIIWWALTCKEACDHKIENLEYTC